MEIQKFIERKVRKTVARLKEQLTEEELENLSNGKAFIDVTEKRLKSGGADFYFAYKLKNE